ncbi:MAG: hypothetical protein LT071_14010 [Nocardioides sp.]|nr:hypothetical protein [Nocardioides sp.]
MTDTPGRADDHTTADVVDSPPGKVTRWMRRAGITLLGLIVVAAALDLLGPRTGEVEESAGPWTLAVSYPSVTRAGQPVPLHLSITSDTGFGDTVQLSLCDEFFNDLDFQNWYPNPAAETNQPPRIVYEFDPPPSGDTLEISLDARTAPGQFGELDDCEVAVLVDDEPVVSTSFTAWRLP